MEERLKFIARLLEGEKMAAVCREFGISRKTGYKIFNRYKELGLDGLHDQSRRPLRYANQLPFQVESRILAIKQERPTWGAPKTREKLVREYPQIRPPAKSTVHAVLDRHGLPAIAAGRNSFWQLLFLEREPENQVDIMKSDVERMKRLDLALLRGKVYVLPGVRRFVSAVNGPEDLDWTLDALDTACRAVA